MKLRPEDRRGDNQRWGDFAMVTSNEDIGFYATGLRNPFDIVIGGATGLVYCQDNGSNRNFGAYVTGYNNTSKLPEIFGTNESGGDEV